MKKILLLSALVVGVFSVPAYADSHGDGEHKKGRVFKKLDANEDGTISRAEFDAMHEKRFEAMDADGNGEISKEEAKSHREQRREKRQERRENKQNSDE